MSAAPTIARGNPGLESLSLRDILRTGEIWTHTAASLARIAVGFGGAVLVAVLLGLVAFLSRLARGIVHDVLAVCGAGAVRRDFSARADSSD